MSIDTKIEALLKTISEQKADIAENKKEMKDHWLTHCSLKLGNPKTSTNIMTASTHTLQLALAELLMRTHYTISANELLSINEEITFDGFSVSDWITDILKRQKTIQVLEKEKKLMALEARAKQIISGDMKREMEYQEIMNSLK